MFTKRNFNIIGVFAFGCLFVSLSVFCCISNAFGAEDNSGSNDVTASTSIYLKSVDPRDCRVEGVVLDSATNSGLGGVLISFTKHDGEYWDVWSTESDNNGNFSLNVEYVDGEITFQKVGYKSASHNIVKDDFIEGVVTLKVVMVGDGSSGDGSVDVNGHQGISSFNGVQTGDIIRWVLFGLMVIVCISLLVVMIKGRNTELSEK